MQVNIVPHHGVGNRGVILVLLLQRLKQIEDLLGRNGLLINPALLAFGGLHSQEAATALQHFQLVAVIHGSGPV